MIQAFQHLLYQDRIEGEQTFSVIRNSTMTQVQVGEIVVGDIISVGNIGKDILTPSFIQGKIW